MWVLEDLGNQMRCWGKHRDGQGRKTLPSYRGAQNRCWGSGRSMLMQHASGWHRRGWGCYTSPAMEESRPLPGWTGCRPEQRDTGSRTLTSLVLSSSSTSTFHWCDPPRSRQGFLSISIACLPEQAREAGASPRLALFQLLVGFVSTIPQLVNV